MSLSEPYRCHFCGVQVGGDVFFGHEIPEIAITDRDMDPFGYTYVRPFCDRSCWKEWEEQELRKREADRYAR